MMRPIIKTLLAWLITILAGSLLRCLLFVIYNGHTGLADTSGLLILLIEGALLLIPAAIFFHLAGRSIGRIDASPGRKKLYLSLLSPVIIFACMFIVLQPPLRPWPLLQVFVLYALPYSLPWIGCVWALGMGVKERSENQE